MARLVIGVLFLSLFVVYLSQCAPVRRKDKARAMKFLKKYHYLPGPEATDDAMRDGIKNFQRFFHLYVDGVPDARTMDLMKKPRCGNPDMMGEKRFVTARPWSKTDLTYKFINHGDDLDVLQVERIVAKAFAFWSDVSGLTFTAKSSDKEADIEILFDRLAHGDGKPFDGPGGTLAHASLPSGGQVHFDEDETFTHGTETGINLLWVAVHEIGHALGLEHTDVDGAIMYPYYTGYDPDIKLHDDDIQGIQSLYPPTGPILESNALEDLECEDRSLYCEDYFESGYCVSHSSYMEDNCKKTCGLC